jgi:hypothetical protein
MYIDTEDGWNTIKSIAVKITQSTWKIMLPYQAGFLSRLAIYSGVSLNLRAPISCYTCFIFVAPKIARIPSLTSRGFSYDRTDWNRQILID